MAAKVFLANNAFAIMGRGTRGCALGGWDYRFAPPLIVRKARRPS
jgi:hypothetical protein